MQLVVEAEKTGRILHVRWITTHNEEQLMTLFELKKYGGGTVVRVDIRLRVNEETGADTSYALVHMASAAEVAQVIAAASEVVTKNGSSNPHDDYREGTVTGLDGRPDLAVNRFSVETALASTGALRSIMHTGDRREQRNAAKEAELVHFAADAFATFPVGHKDHDMQNGSGATGAGGGIEKTTSEHGAAAEENEEEAKAAKILHVRWITTHSEQQLTQIFERYAGRAGSVVRVDIRLRKHEETKEDMSYGA